MDDLLFVTDLESGNEARHKEFYKKGLIRNLKLTGSFLVELSVPADVVPKVTAAEEVHDQVEVFPVLEGIIHINQEWTV